MAVYISACPIGIFAIDENKKIIASRIFKPNAEEIAKKLRDFEMGNSDEVKEIVKDLRNRGMEQVVTSQPNLAADFLQANMRELAKTNNFVKTDLEFNRILGEIGAAQAKLSISKSEKKDRLIVQTISALNDMDKILNTMSERLREWYGLHYPEFKVSDHAKFAAAVAEYGERENFTKFTSSMGMKLAKEDVEVLKSYAHQLHEMYQLHDRLEKYLAKVVPEEMPNTSTLVGHLLAARLLAHAGTLERLAKMPSSTMQLLGAEKALFRALKEQRRGGRSRESKVPRFGILFTYPDISSAPNEQRGKIARLLSAKLSMAARIDFYSKENKSKELVDDYRQKLAEVRKSGNNN